MAPDQLPHPESALGVSPPPNDGAPTVSTLSCARIPFPRGAGEWEALAGFTTYARGWSPLGSAAWLLAQTRWSCRGRLTFPGIGAKEKPKTYRKKIMGWGVQIPVPEMVRTMMGTWPSAWHEHQEQAEQDTTCGARLRRCQRFPQHPHPLLQGALVALPRKEFFLGRGVYSVASSLASPCSAHTRRTWRLSVLFAPMATCERQLLQEAVCVLPLPPPLLPQRW